MVTQVTFTADQDLKNRALEKAKSEGITLKAILVYSMKGFVEGKINFGLIQSQEPEAEELHFKNPSLYKKALKLAKLLS